MTRSFKCWLDDDNVVHFRRTEKPAKALRNVESVETVDCYFEVECVAPEFNTNTVDPDMDIDGSVEFGDIDNEVDGLTVIEGEEDIFYYLTGEQPE